MTIRVARVRERLQYDRVWFRAYTIITLTPSASTTTRQRFNASGLTTIGRTKGEPSHYEKASQIPGNVNCHPEMAGASWFTSPSSMGPGLTPVRPAFPRGTGGANAVHQPPNQHLRTERPAATAETGRLSLPSTFPQIDEDVILSVTRHELHADDLWKLDSRCRNIPSSLCHRFKDVSSLLIPLENYFAILIAGASQGDLIKHMSYEFSRYRICLLKYSEAFKWEALLEYHLGFFELRRRDMAHGDYTGWSKVDVDLYATYLHPNRLKAVYPGRR
ncbi:hypothetical protein BDN72DRAFT_674231 [Pluteus cervinus]|uniref:Uncharacterized protein n=1 Tax=Pluteus cervinus TaxID=181527 RepID=A0ACD2ZZU5_9AGAR|nr:hypothetical protein BDN72DRAFT_674231 [Pluteus cervinus]